MGSHKSGGTTRFKKGKSGNPSGRAPLDPDIKKLRGLTKEQFKELATLLLSGTQEDMQRFLDTPGSTMLTQWMAKVLLVGCEKGDYKTLDEILNRLIGKVKDEVDVNLLKPYVAILSDGRRLEMGVKGSEEG